MEKNEKYSKEWFDARSKKLHEVIERYKKEDAERECLKNEAFDALSPERKRNFSFRKKEREYQIACAPDIAKAAGVYGAA